MTVSSPTSKSKSSVQSPVPQSSLKLRFYRQCRLWHGYLSAFAFAALLFFAVTGAALNHPDWFALSNPRTPPVQLTLTSSQLQALRDSPAPAEKLTEIVADQTTLYGEYKDGATAVNQIFARLRGARGSSDIRANLSDGSVVVTVERATTIGLLNALHRGEQAGAAWRVFIDILAGILIAVSLVGYAIFFSMTARLKTALLITGLSLLGTVALFTVVVP
jgi:uncharacterized protein